MESMNAAMVAGQQLQRTIARVREQIATSGEIRLEDFKLVFGNPMESVSFRDLHERTQREALTACEALKRRGIDLGAFKVASSAGEPSS